MMTRKKLYVIFICIVIVILLVGFITIDSKKIQEEPIPKRGELWRIQYDSSEAFPIESFKQKLCDLRESCTILPDVRLGTPDPYDRIYLEITGFWENERTEIKQILEDFPGISDVEFRDEVLPEEHYEGGS